MSEASENEPVAGGALAERRPSSRLNPAKIRSGLRRRWFEYRMERTPLRSIDGVVDLGNRLYGGWRLPGSLIEPSWLCYSVGAGGETSVDMDLIARYGITVRSIDPIPKYVQLALEHAEGNPRLTAHEAAVAAVDGPIRMQQTHDPLSESVSSAGLYDSRSYVEFRGRTLPSLMAELGDQRIDLLKLDIEGGEYEVIPSLDLQALGVKVFATQLHHTGTVRDALRLIAMVSEQGYDAVACRPVVKIAFARRDLL
jgi:FkbM family methyltransferase